MNALLKLQSLSISTTIDALPPEIIIEIFKNINTEELVRNCKLVSKCWYLIVSNLKIKRLIVKDPAEYDNENRWYHTNIPLNYDLDMVKSAFFISKFNKPLLLSLKYLIINFNIENSEFKLNDLNIFKGLQQLDIEYKLKYHNENYHLELPELKILHIGFICKSYFSIDCPKLKIVRFFSDFKFLNFNHPLTIKHLEILKFDEKLKLFKNLKYLQVYKNENLENILSILPKLTSLHLNKVSHMNDYNALKRVSTNLMEQKKVQERSELKIYVYGVKLTDGKEFDEYGFKRVIADSNGKIFLTENFFIDNYDYLADFVPYGLKFNYTLLMNLFSNKNLPDDFFQKFVRLKIILASEIQNLDHFLWFIKNLKSLDLLNLISSNLDQSFYDQLPVICYIKNLKISLANDLNMDYEFLERMRILYNLELRHYPIDKAILFLKLFKKLDFFRSFTIYECPKYIFIKKIKSANQFFIRYLIKVGDYQEVLLPIDELDENWLLSNIIESTN